jgi:hypothetical protein
MKVQQILSAICLIALVLPMTVNAEIYKWKDRNGVIVYSDTPPSPNVKVESIGSSTIDTLERPEPTRINSEIAEQAKSPAEESGAVKTPPPVTDPKLEAIRARAKQAAAQKKNRETKEEDARIKAENCKAAKANYQTYAQGGRIYKINEQGERVYEDDAGLAAGKAKAEADMRKYCN